MSGILERLFKIARSNIKPIIAGRLFSGLEERIDEKLNEWESHAFGGGTGSASGGTGSGATGGAGAAGGAGTKGGGGGAGSGFGGSGRSGYDGFGGQSRHGPSDRSGARQGGWPREVVEDLAVFNLRPPASMETVKKARNREMKKFHSDHFINDPEKFETSKQIMQIYNAAYDRLRHYYEGR